MVSIDPLAELIGQSPAIAAVRETLERVLRRQAAARRPVPILLLGETGVGKSLVAGLLHRGGPRAGGRFVEVNCAAVPEPLLEAELFGFERGAFTDAKQAKPGLLQEAHGGTLFLDELGLLPEASQAKLLKVLEERTVRRLGGTRTEPADAWIIAATSEDLEEAARGRRFRADLYHRLAVVTVRLPALRERPEDIVPLGERFLREICDDAGLPLKTLTADARAALRAHAWPGNVRELKNVLTRAALLTDALELTREALELGGDAPPSEPVPAPEAELDADQIAKVLRETGWNVSRAAARLGLSRGALRYRIDKHNLSPDRSSTAVDAPTPPGALATLPRTITSWIGRERELRELALRVATHPVVTLTGPGGVGKTRLAVTVARELRSVAPDGVWFVELASVRDAGLVAQAVASALGVPEDASRSRQESLVAALAARQAVLIVDNCEHLIGACAALVETLVRACPRLRVLATSRERLDIAGESIFRVPSLILPGEGRRAPEDIADSEAVRLFVDRARLVDPAFRLTDQNAEAVVELCRRLDGLPLAIELAAARVPLLTVEQIVARLHDRFRLLTEGGRTTAARQQTLQATLDWSHDLLSPPERALLRRLSVFTGGFTLDAVEAICAGNGIESDHVLHLLTQLVNKSLVTVEGAGPVARYRLLETIWEYGRAQAVAAGEVAWLRQRHQAWFVAFAEDAMRASRGAKQAAWLERMEVDYHNLLTALSWRHPDGTNDEPRLRLAAALGRFWTVRGRLREGDGWLQTVLAETSDAIPEAKARVLNAAGIIARDLGDYDRAAARHTEALALRGAIEHRGVIAACLQHLGALAHDRARYRTAEAHFAEALPLWRHAGDHEGLAISLNDLGRTRRFQGDYERAAALGRESLELFRSLGHAWGVGRALYNLANTAHYRGDLTEARPLYDESLQVRKDLGHQQGIGMTLNSLALLSGAGGDLKGARHFGESGLALLREMGDRRGIGVSLWTLGRVALWESDVAAAERLTRESLAIRAALDDRLGIACCLETMAEVLLENGDALRAARLLGASASERQAIGAPRPPLERDHHERLLRSLREHLSDSAVDPAPNEAAVRVVVAEELTGIRK